MAENQQISVCVEEVFCQIHNEQSKPLRNFLYYKYGSLEKARDNAQEAFIRLWKNCSQVTYQKAAGYLFTVANRLFLDEMRREKVVLKFSKLPRSEQSIETNPEFIFQHDEFKGLLEQAISNLPERQRVVFLMSRMDKMSNKEIAVALSISLKGVEKNMTLALKKLKSALVILKNQRI